MLEKMYKDYLHQMKGQSDFEYFPPIIQREKWEGIDRGLREDMIHKADQLLEYEWDMIYASDYMIFQELGNRSAYESKHFSRRHALFRLTIAECIKNDGTYMKQIINGIWCICEESTWVVPAHQNMYPHTEHYKLPDVQDVYIDLSSSDTGALLATIYYLLGDKLSAISKNITKRLQFELENRIITPFLNRKDCWWMGYDSRPVNNWAPWCASNTLLIFLLVEKNMEKRQKAVEKTLYILDRFIDAYGEDGGCEEGSCYWIRASACMYEGIQLINYGLNHPINPYSSTKIRNMLSFIEKTHIDEDLFINFADSCHQIKVDADICISMGRKMDNDNMIALGKYFQKKYKEESAYCGYSPSPSRTLKAIFNYPDSEPEMPSNKTKDFLYEDIQWAIMKEFRESNKGLYLAAKGGHNDESHNHNDLGHYIIYKDGIPIIIDVGVGTYTAKTFSKERYDIWTMQSAYHNLPLINQAQQKFGQSYYAKIMDYNINEQVTRFQLDLTKAYPESASMELYTRDIQLHRSNISSITIKDDIHMHAPTGDIEHYIMTCQKPEIIKGAIGLIGESLDKLICIHYDHVLYEVDYETITLEDQALIKSWGNTLYRIVFKPVVISSRHVFEIKFV